MPKPLKLISAISLPLLAGFTSGRVTAQNIPTWYATLNKPFFSPPNWLFAPVWTLLYVLMGVAWYLVWQQGMDKPKVREATYCFLIQLGLNFLWSISFFGFQSPLLGLINISLLLVFIVLTMKKFLPLSKTAFYLLVPYLLWVSFATILNLAIKLLN